MRAAKISGHNFLSVEREKLASSAKESRLQQQPALSALDKENRRKCSETRLQALAQSERERRNAEVEREKRKSKEVVQPQKKQPSAATSSAQNKVHAADEPEKLCKVVRVHPDGSVDLQLSSGEIVCGLDGSMLQRPSGRADKLPPPATAIRVVGDTTTVQTGGRRKDDAMSSAPPPAAPPQAAATSSDLDELEAQLARALVQDTALLGAGGRRVPTKGGRRTLGATQASGLTGVASALSWQ